jgi:hypothetical protein
MQSCFYSNCVSGLDACTLFGPILFVPAVQAIVAFPEANVFFLVSSFCAALAAALKFLFGVEVNVV